MNIKTALTDERHPSQKASRRGWRPQLRLRRVCGSLRAELGRPDTAAARSIASRLVPRRPSRCAGSPPLATRPAVNGGR